MRANPPLCRQDTTSPWSTDYGRDILCQALIQMLEAAYGQKKKRNEETQFSRKTKNWENEKNEKKTFRKKVKKEKTPQRE